MDYMQVLFLQDSKFVKQGGLQLIEDCKKNRRQRTHLLLGAVQKKIAKYPIEKLENTKIDELPKDFFSLCVRLARTAIVLAKTNGINVEVGIVLLIESAKHAYKEENVSMAFDKILDAIDRLKFTGVLSL